MRKMLLILAILAAAATAAAAAGGQEGDWEVGPYVGYAVLDDYSGADPDNGFLYGARVGYFFTPRWSVEASYQLLSTELEGSSADFDVTSVRLNLLYSLREGKRFRWHLTGGVGSEATEVDPVLDVSDVGYNAGGGARWFLTDAFAVRADARWVWTDVGGVVDASQNNYEGTLGVSWTFGGGAPPDADRDGVPDGKDACPDTPRGASVDARGCPTDADGDGVWDGLDKCPDTPKGWPVGSDGCPKDTDGDGVADGADGCPDTPKGATVDAKGCPKDSDGDGVFDGIDRCADTPKGAKVDPRGCPLDSDGDKVYDGLDQCPGTPSGTKVDSKGCPLPEPEPSKAEPLFVGEKKTLVLEGVNFATNSAELTPESGAVLDKVAASLRDWPEVRVEIGGHTDSTGGDAHNRALSQRRAEAVRDFLAARGVDAGRLTAKGYGESRPMADNASADGRAKNRRVELTRLD